MIKHSKSFNREVDLPSLKNGSYSSINSDCGILISILCLIAFLRAILKFFLGFLIQQLQMLIKGQTLTNGVSFNGCLASIISWA